MTPIFARVAAALAAGTISDVHARVIRSAIMAIPPEKAAESSAVAEEFLVAAALHGNPRTLRQTAHLLLAHLHQDGKRPDERSSHRRRQFGLFPALDGGYDGTFHFTAETRHGVVGDPRPVGCAADGDG